MVALTGVLMLVAARIAFQTEELNYFTFDRGIIFPSANLWISGHWLTMAVNTAIVVITALMWLMLVQIFNPFRSMTGLTASFFMVMMLSVPDIMDQLYTGTLLAAVMPVCLTLLWSSFDDPLQMRRICLIFILLSALSMTQYCFAVYIPVFILGCAQMKILKFRTVLVILIGVLTPWWIVFGLGLADFADFHLPEMPGFFNLHDIDATVNIMAVGGITILLLIIGWVGNVMRVITFNSNLRAFNGSIAMIGLFTIVAMFADFTNSLAYLPTLMTVCAYQLSFMLGRSSGNRGVIPALIIMTVYIGFFVLRLVA